MDLKIITGFLLCFCFMASISISQSVSASLDSKLRFRRQDGETGDSTTNVSESAVTTGQPGSTASDGATAAAPGAATAADGATTGADGSTAAADGATTAVAGATTAAPGAATAADGATTGADGATTAVAGVTTAAPGAATAADGATTAADGATTAVAGVTTAADGATTVAAGVTTAADGATTAADGATTAADGATTAADGATTAADGATTAADGATTAVAGVTTAADGATTVADGVTTAGDAATTGSDSATTVGDIAGSSEGGATTIESVTGGTTGSTEAAGTTEGKATGGDVALETSTIDTTGDSTDVLTSAKPGNGHGDDGDSSTDITSISEGTASTGSVSDQTVTTDAVSGTVTETTDMVTTDSISDTTTADIETTTGIEGGDGNDRVTQASITEGPGEPSPHQPDSGARVELRVVVNPETLQVQYGRTVEMTCIVYGGDANTQIYWIQEEPERRYALIDQASDSDKQVTASQVTLQARITLDDRGKIGKYTCMAQDGSGNSGSAILTMQEGGGHHPQPVYPQPVYPQPDYSQPDYSQPGPVQPSSGGRGSLRIVVPDMTDGDYIEVQCEGASPEDEGRIEWYFNERLVSDEQPLYPRGKTLHIRPISREYLGTYRCSVPGSGYTDAISVLTFGGAPPPPPTRPPYGGSAFTVSVNIVQGQTTQGQAQEGSQVILRCQPSEQAANYQWTFASSANQPPATRGYTDQLVLPQASLADSGTYTCQATNARGQTATGSANLHITRGPAPPSPPVSGQCTMDEATCRNGRCIPRAYLCDGKNDCGDNSDESCGPPTGTGSDACQPNEIHCTVAGRGRKCVQKFWMCDGDRDCDDGSDEEPRYCELLPRQRYCKTSEFQCAGGNGGGASNPVCIPRSFQCDGYNDCPDRSDEIGCVKPTVISPPQRQIEVNAGSTLSIQCTARGSPAPYINWRLNWGFICGDGSDNGRCQMAQSIDPSDPTLVTGTLTIRNTNANDGGAYSCEALNNQGFIFAIPDAIVNVIIGQPRTIPTPIQPCNCNGHTSYCSPDGRCLNCQHNTAGASCEYCAPRYQGDARQGTPYDCQPIPVVSEPRCNPSGTHMERAGRCICKYNVDGDRCDQCKRSHFYLNPTTPNGCLPCFCSGVSNDCSSSDWRRQTVSLPLSNWGAVPKNFATDRYEARDRIQQRDGGNTLVLDQSSLGRPANEVLYWKAPKEALGDVVTLYDGQIVVHFTNDGNENDAPTSDEFIWLRGNNIDLVHKFPQAHRFRANTNATYSVACNERTFTRKDGTHIDRENILMALSDLDTFLVKINPIGGRRNAVLQGVSLSPATQAGHDDTALTVEACRCPSNYTGTSCEKCADGYGRRHPLVGIYLGQCWACRSLCNERSDRCDRDTGKCLECQDNSDGDRCERCRSGYVRDTRSNQCVQDGQGGQYPSEPAPPSYGTGSRGTFYVDQRPYDPREQTPLNIVLDGNRPEQRVPLQVLNAQPRSVVWGRTDGSALPANVVQEGNDLVFRYPSAEQAGHYISTITHQDGTLERVAIYLDYRPGQVQPVGPAYGYVTFSPASPLNIREGASQSIQPQSGYSRVQWVRADGQQFPSGVYQNGDALQISGARSEHSGTYQCELYGNDGRPVSAQYEIYVQAADRRPATPGGGPPKVDIKPRIINLKEGQRMIVQYTVASIDPIKVIWNKLTDQGYQPIPSLFRVEENRLVLDRATPESAGTYKVIVRNAYGEDQQELRINVEPRRGRGRGQQAGAPQIRFPQEQYDVNGGEVVNVVPNISGGSGAQFVWSKDGSTDLPAGVTALDEGALRIDGRSNQIDGRYNLDVTNAYGRVSSPINVRWIGTSYQQVDTGKDHDRSHSQVDVRLESRDEQSHQVGRDINLQCAVQGDVERPYEYTFTKDGQSLENNIEVHPNGLLIIRNAQANDAGRYRCEVSFPSAPHIGTQESSYDLRVEAGSAGGHDHGQQHANDDHQQHQSQPIEVTVEPSEVTIGRGETATITCHVKGSDQYTVKWGKYAHDTTLPDYARQQGNSIILTPTHDTPPEQMYLQCQVDIPGHAQPHHAYAPVNIRDGDESSKKKKKKRRS